MAVIDGPLPETLAAFPLEPGQRIDLLSVDALLQYLKGLTETAQPAAPAEPVGREEPKGSKDQ